MLREIFFEIGPALQAMFAIGFEPKEEDFYEFTHDHYEKFHHEVGDTPEKMYILLPKDQQHSEAEVMAVTETEKTSLLKATEVIEEYCLQSRDQFNTDEDKLRYAAKMLPPIFSEKTRFSPLEGVN